MAQFLGLVQLNAANFESGAAADGEVLTADGNGGATWARAAVYIVLPEMVLDINMSGSVMSNLFEAQTGFPPRIGDRMQLHSEYVEGVSTFLHLGGWSAPLILGEI